MSWTQLHAAVPSEYDLPSPGRPRTRVLPHHRDRRAEPLRAPPGHPPGARLLVAAVCAVSDAVLIAARRLGSRLRAHGGPVAHRCRAVGAVRPSWSCYGLLAARRAWRPSGQALGAADAQAATAGDPGAGTRHGRSRHTTSRPGDRGRSSHSRPSRRAHRPRPDLAEPPRLPRHRLPPGNGRQHARRRALALRRRSDGGQRDWFFALAIGARYLGRWLERHGLGASSTR